MANLFQQNIVVKRQFQEGKAQGSRHWEQDISCLALVSSFLMVVSAFLDPALLAKLSVQMEDGLHLKSLAV